MQFLYPALTIGFFLALLPLLIHLINMMRHRRVQWAAMEFLLQSYKKHRRWVWLKQLLLLLARMAAVLLIVAMLAQLVTQRRYEGLFGNTLTHHYVLLDDSMSMSDRAGGTDALERGLKFTRQLAAEAAKQEFHQRFTLIRFSKAQAAVAAAADPQAQSLPRIADLNAADVDSKFTIQLEEACTTIHPTQLPVGPEAALQVARQMMQQNGEENRIVYIVSDFRAKEWDNPSELRQLLSDLEKEDARLHLVNCCRTAHNNLAITDLTPTEETRASGVPLFMNVAVTNYGDRVAENVQLKVRTYFHASSLKQHPTSDRPSSKEDESPMLQIDRIEPGETSVERVQVFFPKAGKHAVEALLPDDTIAADNRRWSVVEFPEYESVLVVDGDPNERNAFYIDAIFQPGQRAQTGIRADLESVVFLRDTTPEVLRHYSAIYLFDVDRLDDRAVTNLETYVEQGGGLAIFVGPQVNINFYNEKLYRDGAGLVPLPIAHDDLLDSDPIDNTPDILVEATDHSIFQELVQGQNPIIRMMHVQRYLRPPSDWLPAPESSVRILARLRNRAPLAVEKAFGKGRVVMFLTTYAPYWNDIALGPGVILALRLQSHLGFSRRVTTEQEVATGIHVRLDRDKYRQDIRIFAPSDDPATPLLIDDTAETLADDTRFMRASIGPNETQQSGIYEMWFSRTDGSIDADRFAVNVDPREGNLAQTPGRDIVAKLEPVSVDIGYADQYETAAIEDAGYNQSLLLMCFLILLLIGEQLLAYFTSYHPSRRAAATANAGRVRRRNMANYQDADDVASVQAHGGRPALAATEQGAATSQSRSTKTARGARS